MQHRALGEYGVRGEESALMLGRFCTQLTQGSTYKLACRNMAIGFSVVFIA